MVKIKAICRNTKEYQKQTNTELQKVQRNPSNTTLHPFQGAREYQRALNGAKLEKMFAKPFIKSLDNHSDGIISMAKARSNMVDMLSGAADGEVIFWDLPRQKPMFQINAHERFVRGVTFAGNHALAADNIFVSTGDDAKVCIWSLSGLKSQFQENINEGEDDAFVQTFKNYTPKASYQSKTSLLGCDASYNDDLFATAGAIVQVWSYERSTPVYSFKTWECDTVTKCKFNPTETSLLASVCNDRSLIFYDIRGKSSLQKVYLKNKSSALAWNPQEPMNIVVVSTILLPF